MEDAGLAAPPQRRSRSRRRRRGRRRPALRRHRPPRPVSRSPIALDSRNKFGLALFASNSRLAPYRCEQLAPYRFELAPYRFGFDATSRRSGFLGAFLLAVFVYILADRLSFFVNGGSTSRLLCAKPAALSQIDENEHDDPPVRIESHVVITTDSKIQSQLAP